MSTHNICFFVVTALADDSHEMSRLVFSEKKKKKKKLSSAAVVTGALTVKHLPRSYE